MTRGAARILRTGRGAPAVRGAMLAGALVLATCTGARAISTLQEFAAPGSSSTPLPSPLGPPRFSDAPTLPAPADVPDGSSSGKAPPPGADLAFGAYQRGFYTTALREAMKRLGRNANDGPAMTLVGELYSQGLGVKGDKTEAARWFKLGAESGDANAMFELGMAEMKGEGTPQDRDGARALFRKASAAGNPQATFYLGVMALQGNGVEKDETGAARYFLKAANRNNPVAQDRAARLLVAGRGVKKDVVEGMKWHMLSQSTGLKDEWLDGEMRKLTHDQRDAVERAVRQYIGS